MESTNQFNPINQIFQFNLNTQDLQCFISKQIKSEPSHKNIPNTNQHAKPSIKVIQEHSPVRPNNSPYLDLCFDHKVLFTSYGPQEVYVDEEPNNFFPENMSNSNDDLEIEQSEIINQCMRAITEDTNDNSRSDLSNNNTMIYYNQQIMDTSRLRTKLYAEEPKYCIRTGESQYDGRTTLMLRNIPNKYTQEMVLQEVETAGLEFKYDFFYLPVDFKNDCNVGYAFINLIDVEYVQRLFEKFHGKKWPKFNSEKICQVCYARIQGTPQLINHFRFSNTLQRDNRCRPLIYVNMNADDKKTKDEQYKLEKHHGSFTI